jgi:hypothetical protein
MSLRKTCLLIATFWSCTGFGAITQDLGKGLSYLRIADLTTELKELNGYLEKPAVVLDLRNAIGTQESVEQFAKLLDDSPARGKALRIILINPQTAPGLIDAVSADRERQLTIGPSSPAVHPDVAVKVSAEEDRRAYDAMNAGLSLEKLISNKLEKRRFDEASLARNHSSTGPAEPEEGDLETDLPDSIPSGQSAPNPPTPAKEAPAAPHDLILERAIQVHRALTALKR